MYGAETRTLRKVDRINLGSSEMWYWRRMEKISWTRSVKNEVLYRVKKERNILHTIKKEGKLSELVTCYVGTAFSNTLLKER